MQRFLSLILLCLTFVSLLIPADQPALAQDTATSAPPASGSQTSTPYPDGAVVHEVKSGETLITIAESYSVTVQTILALNNLTLTDPIFPGDRLIIRAAYTPTPTSNITSSPTERPSTPTRRPTRTPTARPPTRTPTLAPLIPATATPIISPETAFSDPIGQGFLAAILILGITGAGLLLAGSVAKIASSRPKKNT